MSARRKQADIEQVMTTFSAHISTSYPEPQQFRDNLAGMLAAKKKRLSPDSYVEALEKNLVFLIDLVTEGEACLELVLGRINDRRLGGGEIAAKIGEMEQRVRSLTVHRREELFAAGGKGELSRLAELRARGGEAYIEKLEFNYIYYMALRIFLFEFLGILVSVRAEYSVQRVDEAAFEHVRNHVLMTANFYLGNIAVGQVAPEGSGPA